MEFHTASSLARTHHLTDTRSLFPLDVVGSARRLCRSIVHQLEERRAIAALAELDDRTLSDIGVRRAEIPQVVRRSRSGRSLV
jgi:uncharacterized protein YjiS (DUF1127 family)